MSVCGALYRCTRSNKSTEDINLSRRRISSKDTVDNWITNLKYRTGNRRQKKGRSRLTNGYFYISSRSIRNDCRAVLEIIVCWLGGNDQLRVAVRNCLASCRQQRVQLFVLKKQTLIQYCKQNRCQRIDDKLNAAYPGN